MARGKAPWLWPDFTFELTENGKEQGRNLKILHAVTNKVVYLLVSFRRKDFNIFSVMTRFQNHGYLSDKIVLPYSFKSIILCGGGGYFSLLQRTIQM